jgi:hypothetical protein
MSRVLAGSMLLLPSILEYNRWILAGRHVSEYQVRKVAKQREVGSNESIQYFCSAMADDPNQPPTPKPLYLLTQWEKVLENGNELFSRRSDHFWPTANTEQGLEWNLMPAPEILGGQVRLTAQFLRANILIHVSVTC